MNYDLEHISKELQAKSASKYEIVLPYKDVIAAINELKEKEIAIISWEPWLVFPDGSKRHTDDVMGMITYKQSTDETWKEYVNKSCDFVMKTINIENAELESSQYRKKYLDMVFYYCIVISVKVKHTQK